jgi:molybdopterin synthase sulfur carrier subunit
MAQLLFLGRLEDVAGAAAMHVPLAGPTPLESVIGQLQRELAAALDGPRIRLAVNGELVGSLAEAGGLMVADSDELAFLPPVSGG